MKKNPFYNRQRITSADAFFGRKNEIDVLYSAVVTHQCRSLVGERKIGKSSLLTYIGNPVIMQRYGLSPDQQIILYFDLEGLASAGPGEFWSEVLDRASDSLQKSAAPPHDLVEQMRRAGSSGEVRFMQVRRLLRRMRDAGFDLAICLDEFEALARNQSFETDFYGELRSLAGELGLVFLTASKRSLYELTYEHSDTLSSPFFNIFTELPLSTFTEQEANELLSGISTQAGAPFCAEEIHFAQDLAGLHPFFLQVAGFHLFENRLSTPPDPPTIHQVRKRFLAEAEDHYRYLWSQLSMTQQMALINLEQAAEPDIRVLRSKNLVLEKNDRPIPFSQTFAEFLNRQHTDQITLSGPDSGTTGATDLTGKTLGVYRVVSPLGKGGMAEVYKGYQPSLDRYVALKILAPHLALDPAFQERFQREATAVARLRHPSIVQVFDFGVMDQITYMVMEYVGGPTLKERLRTLARENRSLAREEMLAIAGCVAAGLDHAHARGMVHRDVKPANILLRDASYHLPRFATEPYAVLTDFGVVKMLEGIQVTATGTTLGTPDYMSPEQAQGKEVAQSSDIYSLAVVVYEMLVGRLPFTAETPIAVLLKHMMDEPPLPHEIRPDLPLGVDRVIQKALAKDPEQRYSSAGEFVSALSAVLNNAGEGSSLHGWENSL